jgi:monoamine oxidase
MNVNRREFVKLSGFAMGGLSLSPDLTWALPQAATTRSSNGKRIAILGAGMAGLAAGWKLHGAGYSVIILEAQMHPGGRVHTIREGLSDDLYAEAGAGRIFRPKLRSLLISASSISVKQTGSCPILFRKLRSG